MSIELNTFNRIVYDEMIKRFKITNRVGIEQVMGSGKSYIASRYVEDNQNITCLIISNNIYSLDTYTRNLKEYKNWLFCTYSKLSKMVGKNPLDIENYIQENNISIIIFDEFHHSGADEWQKGVEQLLFVADKKNINCLALSATPIRYLDGARNMFHELHFTTINGMNYSDMFAHKLCGDVNYISLTYIDEEENKRYYSKIMTSSLLENEKSKLIESFENEFTKNNKKNIPNYIRNVLESNVKTKCMKFIAFFSTIEEAEKENILLEKVFSNCSKVIYYTATTNTSEAERKRILKKFNEEQEGVHILKVVDLANEGLHPNGLTGVFFFRRTYSPNVFLQQFGRCISIGNMESVFIFDLVSNLEEIRNYRNSVMQFSLKNAVGCDLIKDNKGVIANNSTDSSKINIVVKKLPILELLQTIEERCSGIPEMSKEELEFFIKAYKDMGENCFQYFQGYPTKILRQIVYKMLGVSVNAKELTPKLKSVIRRAPYEGLDCIKAITSDSKEIRKLEKQAKDLGVNRNLNPSDELLKRIEKSKEIYGMKKAYKGISDVHPVVVMCILKKYFGCKVDKYTKIEEGKWWKDDEVSEIYRIY